MPPSPPAPADPRAAEARRRAAFGRIRQWGDPVLRSRAVAVASFDAALQAQVAEMVAVTQDASGAGLAAPQVGVLNRVIVVRPAPDVPLQALVNPEVVTAAAELVPELEGCLSLGRASVHVVVERPSAVVVEARAVDGTPVRLDATGGLARVLQHEIDHLDGILMLDRAEPAERRDAVRALSGRGPRGG